MSNILKTLEARLADAKVFETELKFRDSNNENLLAVLRNGTAEDKKEVVSNFMRNSMELTEISMQYARLGHTINELYLLCLVEDPEFKFSEPIENFVRTYREVESGTFTVVNGKLINTNPNYNQIVEDYISKQLTEEKVKSILDSPLIKGGA